MTNFDRAQAAYDNATPEYLDDEWRYPCCEHCVDHDWRNTKSKHIVPCNWCATGCEQCGDQAVCPECKGT